MSSNAAPQIQEVGYTMFCTIITNHISMFKGLFVCRVPSDTAFLAIDNSDYKGLCSRHNSKAEACNWLLKPNERVLFAEKEPPLEKKLTPKEFLNQYRDALRDERRLRGQIEDMKESAASAGSRISGTPVQGGNAAGRLSLVDDAVDLEMNELRQALAFSREMKRLIKSTINAVEDSRYRELLTHRYLRLKSWEWIAKVMRYNVDYLRRDLHGEALCAIVFTT